MQNQVMIQERATANEEHAVESPTKWFTCAPVRFDGNVRFFARDSGLLCKGFQEIGVPCQAILPGPPKDDDITADLIRTDFGNRPH